MIKELWALGEQDLKPRTLNNPTSLLAGPLVDLPGDLGLGFWAWGFWA